MLVKKSEVNISLSLQIFYHKLFMAGPTEMDSISLISSLVSMPLSLCHDCLLCGTLAQTINSIIMSGIAPKQNTFKIAQHKASRFHR